MSSETLSRTGMYLAGHVGLALVTAGGLVVIGGVTRRVAAGVGVLVLLASAPDVDLLLAGVSHRGVTHTVWAALGLGGVLAVGGGHVGRSGRRSVGTARFAFGLGVASVLTHLVGDLLTPMGIRPLHPLVATGYSLELVAARDPTANLALLCGGLLVFVLALRGERTGWSRAFRARVAVLTGRGRRRPVAAAPVDEPTMK